MRPRPRAARLDRVVHALERRDVHHPDSVAAEEQSRRVEPRRERVEAAARDRLRAPLDALAAVEQLADLRMRLQLLQQVVHRKLGVAVVEADDHSDREHVVAHRVDERAAELAVLRLRRASGQPIVWTIAVERMRDLPHLLDAELPHLRVVAAQAEVIERDAGEVALRALGEHRHLRDDVGAGLEVGELLAVAAAPLVPGAHADDAAVRDEQVLGGRLGEDHRAALLGAFGEPAPELRERDDDVAVVAHRRRRRDGQGRASASGRRRPRRAPGRSVGMSSIR